MQLISATDHTDHNKLKNLLRHVLDEARTAGATQAEAHLNNDAGFAVTVRQGEVETVEHHHSKGLSLTVYFGHHAGSAVTSDLTQSHQRCSGKSLRIARFTGEDLCNGSADAELMAHHYPDLDLYHPWQINCPGD